LVRVRSNWFKVITLDLFGRKSITNLSTPNFSNRNYDINALSIEPKLTYTMQTKFRLSLGYRIEDKSNSGSEKADIKSLILDGKYNLLSNLSISSSFNYGNIKYTGIPNTNLSYTMLDGLMPGKNILWTFEITKRLSSFLEISVQYEGRKSGESGLINLGRAQVRAIL
jgi:outer membrane protein assembly factor BamA